MKTISTTVHCSSDEHYLIKTTAKKKGFTIINFINYSLDKNLPLKKQPIFNLLINRIDYRFTAQIPEDLHKKLMDNVKSLNSPLRATRMYHIVLTAVLMECEE